MLSDQHIIELHANIHTRYGEDIAQSVIVAVLQNRDNEGIRSWIAWTRRLAFRLWKKEQKFEMRYNREQDTDALPSNLDIDRHTDARLQLQRILEHNAAVSLAMYVVGDKHFSYQRCQQLRVELASQLK